MLISRRRRTLGLSLGPELLVNSDFGAGATGWTVSGADATHIATFSGGTLRYQSDTTSPVLSVQQNNVVTIGKRYRITAVCSAFASGSVSIGTIGGGTITIAGLGTFSSIVTATAANVSISRSSSNVDVTLDSVSIREVFR